MLCTLTCGRKPDHEENYDTGNDMAMQSGRKYCCKLIIHVYFMDENGFAT